MSDWEVKLDMLDAARDGLTADDRQAFNSRLIGALAASHIGSRVWAEAIEAAKDSGAAESVPALAAPERKALEVREGGANICVVDAAESTGRLVYVNPPERIYLVKNDPAMLVDLTLEISHVGGIKVNRSFRVLESELGESVDPDHLQLRITPVDSGLDVERFVVAEAPQDDLLQGRDVFVLRVDREALVARTDDELTHESSPSVGTPKSAVCDNPNPTDGEPQSGAAASSPAAAAPDPKTT